MLRGGSDDKDKKKPAKIVDEEDEDEEDDEEWVDAQEELDDDEDDEEEDVTEEEDWTDVEVMGERVQEVRYAEEDYDPDEEEVEVAGDDEVPLAEVLSEQQEEDEERADDNDMDTDDFVDALEEGIDIEMVSPALNTDDESSSANVDRMDLADAYDEELLAEEEGEQLTPVSATGGDEEESNNNLATRDANIAPGGGTEDETSAVETASDDTPSTQEPDGVITDEMKQALMDLDWKKREIRYMRPDKAAGVIANKLRRPREGMPAGFYTPGNEPTNFSWGKTVKRALVPIVVGAIAISAGEVDWEGLLGASESTLASESTPASSYEAAPVEEAEPIAPPVEEVVVEETTEPDEVEEVQPEEQPVIRHEKGPHSVKPYSHPVDQLDETWLDKVITAIENFIKGILTKEL